MLSLRRVYSIAFGIALLAPALGANRVSAEGLSSVPEPELFERLAGATTIQDWREALVEINARGSLEAADRLMSIGRSADPAPVFRLTRQHRDPTASIRRSCEIAAEEIRYRHTGKRHHLVRSVVLETELRPVGNLAFGCSIFTVRRAREEGIVEARPNLHLWLGSEVLERPEVKEEVRKTLLMLDVWAGIPNNDKIEAHVRAVEHNDLTLKRWGIDYLTRQPSLSEEILVRVDAAMEARIAGIIERRKTLRPLSEEERKAGLVRPIFTIEEPGDEPDACRLAAFWSNHSMPRRVRAAERGLFGKSYVAAGGCVGYSNMGTPIPAEIERTP